MTNQLRQLPSGGDLVMSYNILIVDDSRTIRLVLTKTLKLTGLDIGNIFAAANGKEALEFLKDNWIDLVMTDLNMPVMSGVELVDAMAKNGLMNNIPVVVISTDGSTTRIEELKKKGVRQYIRKPFSPENIEDTICEVLGVSHGTPDA